jgi:hypothetical protein
MAGGRPDAWAGTKLVSIFDQFFVTALSRLKHRS